MGCPVCQAYCEHCVDIVGLDAFGTTHPAKSHVAYHYGHNVCVYFNRNGYLACAAFAPQVLKHTQPLLQDQRGIHQHASYDSGLYETGCQYIPSHTIICIGCLR